MEQKDDNTEEGKKITLLKALDLTEVTAQEPQNESDKRSVFVSNIDFNITPAEIEDHFHDCGIIVRITIFNDNKHLHKNHKQGFAYIEFRESSDVEKALLLDGSILGGNEIKIKKKRTNIRSYHQKRYTLGPTQAQR